MALTNFIPRETLVTAAWLNEVDATVQDALDDPKVTRAELAASTGTSLIGYKGRTLQEHLQDCTNLADYCALDGVTPDDAGWALAIAQGKPIYWPPGLSKVVDEVILQNDQLLFGAGRTKSMFVVGADFNMAARGVLVMAAGEVGAQAMDIGFQFYQANQGVRANCIQYPPAIYGVNTPRFLVDKIRIERAWDGIDATGNAGGARIGFVEIDALNKGIMIDGSFDFFHGGDWHFWVFGTLGAEYDLLRNGVRYDGTVVGLELGLCDGTSLGSICCWRANVVILSTARTSPPNIIKTVELDGDLSRIIMSGGVVSIGQVYTTKSGAGVGKSIEVSAGTLVINSLVSSEAHADNCLYTSGTGKIQVNGGQLQFVNGAAPMALASAGIIQLSNISMQTGVLAYATPHIQSTGTGVLQIRNCIWPQKGGASGNCVQFGADLYDHIFSGNQLADWDYVLPATINLGSYGPNAGPRKTWVPRPTFLTPGNFTPTYTVQSGTFRPLANGIEFECRLVFQTNTPYAGVAGAFVIADLPATRNAGALDSAAGFLANAGFVTLTAGYSFLGVSMPNSQNYLFINQFGSGVGVANLSTGNIPQGTANIQMCVSGFIPTR